LDMPVEGRGVGGRRVFVLLLLLLRGSPGLSGCPVGGKGACVHPAPARAVFPQLHARFCPCANCRCARSHDTAAALAGGPRATLFGSVHRFAFVARKPSAPLPWVSRRNFRLFTLQSACPSPVFCSIAVFGAVSSSHPRTSFGTTGPFCFFLSPLTSFSFFLFPLSPHTGRQPAARGCSHDVGLGLWTPES
jgi:hypothetical protein